jgi:hypothetical protein
MRAVEVREIWINTDGRLCVRLTDESIDLTHIYRALASGVVWSGTSSFERCARLYQENGLTPIGSSG